jgi:hypothetical protein
VIVTCSLNGVLTDPSKFPEVPVTPAQLAQAAKVTDSEEEGNLGNRCEERPSTPRPPR